MALARIPNLLGLRPAAVGIFFLSFGASGCRAMYYRLHPNPMNRNAGRMLKSFEQVLEKFFRQHPACSSGSGTSA